MRIAEIYQSVQGEGFLTGTDSVFVRASGCNLRCWFCDTPYASWRPEGDDLSVDEILRQVATHPASDVILTGGEPMLFAELIPLCESLAQQGKRITIETAGTLYLPVECHLMSISPKLSNSTPSAAQTPRWRERHDRTRHAPDVIRRLVGQYEYQIKFVVDTRHDCDEIESYLDQLPEIRRDRVMLMPQGTDFQQLEAIRAWLDDYCDQHGYRLCPRMQIEWFGVARRT